MRVREKYITAPIVPQRNRCIGDAQPGSGADHTGEIGWSEVRLHEEQGLARRKILCSVGVVANYTVHRITVVAPGRNPSRLQRYGIGWTKIHPLAAYVRIQQTG